MLGASFVLFSNFACAFQIEYELMDKSESIFRQVET